MQKEEYSFLFRQIGKSIRHHRQKAGLSQEALAFDAGTAPNYIGLIERGQRRPSVITLYRLAKALKVELKDLL